MKSTCSYGNNRLCPAFSERRSDNQAMYFLLKLMLIQTDAWKKLQSLKAN